MGVLLTVLEKVRLSCAVFLTIEFTSPWSVRLTPTDESAALRMPNADICAYFCVLAQGQCWMQLPGFHPVKLERGDVIVLPQGEQHVMSSSLGLEPTPLNRLLPRPPSGEPLRLVHGGGGESTSLVCGYLGFEQKFDPLFVALPNLLCIRSRDGSIVTEHGASGEARRPALPSPARAWLAASLHYLMAEATSPHKEKTILLARIAELLFLEMVQRYMQQLPPDPGGWCVALNDRHVGNVLTLMHAEPARPWTVGELAHAVGISRSGLAERFTALLGDSPMRYLTAWRMFIAQQLLQERKLNIAEVARQVGYSSEYAFSRAFRRSAGEPPATWRHHRYFR